MGNVISAASEDASDAGTSRLVGPTESSATATDTATEWDQQASRDEAPEVPLHPLYPSTETFGEHAGWSSPRENESDSALALSGSYTPEEKAAPYRPGPRLILAAPSLLAATRSLPSPARLSSPSEEEQPMPAPLECDRGSLPAVTELREREATAGPSAVSQSAPLSEAPLMATRRWAPFARGLLVAGAVLWMVSALLALVTWRLSRDPLGFDLAQNVSALVRQLERIASGTAESAMAASNDSATRNLTSETALVNQMVEAAPVGGDEQPLI